jgi:hypothetical protein
MERSPPDAPTLSDLAGRARELADALAVSPPCTEAIAGRASCLSLKEQEWRRFRDLRNVPSLTLYRRFGEHDLCQPCRAYWFARRCEMVVQEMLDAAPPPEAPAVAPPAFDPAAWFQQTRPGFPVACLGAVMVLPAMTDCPLGSLVPLAEWLLEQRPDLEGAIHTAVLELTRNEDLNAAGC